MLSTDPNIGADRREITRRVLAQNIQEAIADVALPLVEQLIVTIARQQAQKTERWLWSAECKENAE